MNKNTTLNASQKLLTENIQSCAQKKLAQPSGLTMKFVFGYASALHVYKTKLIGSTCFLVN